MENIFVTKLQIEKVRHLEKIEVKLSDKKPKHLIFTGKNGSGKTSVLDAISAYLENKNLIMYTAFNINKRHEKDFIKRMAEYYGLTREAVDDGKIKDITDKAIEIIENPMKNESERAVELFLNSTWKNLYNEYAQGKFLMAYYKCDRVFQAEVSEHIEKVSLNDAYNLKKGPGDLFVKYLVDLKVTEALSRNGKNSEKADAINNWFLHFESLLQQIFEDSTLQLKFDEDTFAFVICQEGKEPYNFNCMSSGFSAIMDIVLDIMMRMVKLKGRVFEFDLPGIVLIDEIETHLHLELQKKIMNILTNLFPNIQFIVSTHSPFVLNSIDNVVIYDLENHTTVKNGLVDVPYEGVVEGYFQVDMLSDELKRKFEEYQRLVQKQNLTDDDFEQIANLEMFLDEIPDYLALDITTEYQRLKTELMQREDI